MVKKIVQKIIAAIARRVIAKYKPVIIGITGSVGKTSAKEAIFLVVSQKYFAFRPQKNLNNEFGLPLAIIGADSPGGGIFGWLMVLLKGVALLVVKSKYPEVLVLEYGIDRVGDMDYLLSIAKPHVSVVTSIGVSHYEYFQDPEVLAKEKGRIVAVLSAEDFAVLNFDNHLVKNLVSSTAAHVVTYGAFEGGIQIKNLQESTTHPFITSFTAVLPAREVSVRIPCLGSPHVSSILSAIAVAEVFKVEVSLIEKGLSQYKAAPGRLNIISGIKRSVIIDDTYNAAPNSTTEALHVFERISGQHKILVLGDMLELGSLSNSAHEEIGKQAARIGPQHLVTVGSGGKIIARSALQNGLPEERVVSLDNSDEAKIVVQNLMREGSIALIKGSQGMRMEKIVKEVMAEPMKSSELLCRQYGKWLE